MVTTHQWCAFSQHSCILSMDNCIKDIIYTRSPFNTQWWHFQTTLFLPHHLKITRFGCNISSIDDFWYRKWKTSSFQGPLKFPLQYRIMNMYVHFCRFGKLICFTTEEEVASLCMCACAYRSDSFNWETIETRVATTGGIFDPLYNILSWSNRLVKATISSHTLYYIWSPYEIGSIRQYRIFCGRFL